MTFYDRMEEESSKKLTQNGSPTFSTSLNKNLDFFALGGAVRDWKDSDIERLFGDSFRENEETALRNLVHLRNIRNKGLGERKAFRAGLKYLDFIGARIVLSRLVDYLPELGRWDDVVYLFEISQDTVLKASIAKKIRFQLLTDFEAKRTGTSASLLAKWLPSITTTSRETRKVAKELVRYMYGTNSPRNEKLYRKTLASLRDYLNVVEVRMTDKDYDKIDYSQVPSLAAIRYRNAFKRNDSYRYEKYLEKLDKGEAKVNAAVTYPYQIISAYGRNPYHTDTLLENAWKSLPDYIGDSNERAIVVADTSGSMSGDPMNVSISLAIYCAQRLKGEFHGKYISFSANPTLNSVADRASLAENIKKVYATEWGQNTDINKTFKLILDTAVKHKMSQDELPNKIIIISDMEFDAANGGVGYSGWGYNREKAEELTDTNYQKIKADFAQHGYEIPQIIFWNVNAKSSTIPVRRDEVGTALVSGLTPAIFETVLNGKIVNPEKLMLDTLYQDKYDFVKGLLVRG